MLKKWGLLITAILIGHALSAQKVEVTALGDPRAVVYDLKYSHSGNLLATTEGNLVNVWNPAQQQLVQTLTGHQETVLALDFAGDDRLASASKDGQLLLWEVRGGAVKRKILAHQGPVNAVAISPDGRLVATGGADKLVKVWDSSSGAEVATFSGHTADVNALAFSKSGHYLVSGAADHLVKVWDMERKLLYKTLEGHKGRVRSVSISPDNEQIASCGDDRRILLWKLQGQTETAPAARFKGLHQNWVTSIDFQDEGRYFISTGHDNNLSISRSTPPELGFYAKYVNPIMRHAGHQYAWKVAFQPGSYRIAIATLGKGILLTDYFEKIFKIPHDLRITAVGKERFSDKQHEFVSYRSKVQIEGEVSRPRMVSSMVLRQGQHYTLIEVKRNGRFSAFVNLEEHGEELEFTISDKDNQINRSVHYIKIQNKQY